MSTSLYFYGNTFYLRIASRNVVKCATIDYWGNKAPPSDDYLIREGL